MNTNKFVTESVALFNRNMSVNRKFSQALDSVNAGTGLGCILQGKCQCGAQVIGNAWDNYHDWNWFQVELLIWFQ